MGSRKWNHPKIPRRTTIQTGAVGLLGLSMNHLGSFRSAAATEQSTATQVRAKSCIYIFLSGGLAQQDSFDDMKPNAPEEVRGEFKPISTKTPGIEICEHLPMLAQRSEDWALVRSLTHPTNQWPWAIFTCSRDGVRPRPVFEVTVNHVPPIFLRSHRLSVTPYQHVTICRLQLCCRNDLCIGRAV